MKINNTKTLGETIRARRKELHYTQAYLAEFTGLSVTFISDVERGKTTAEIEKIIRLINVLGLNLLVEKMELFYLTRYICRSDKNFIKFKLPRQCYAYD